MVKISALPNQGTPTLADKIPVVSGGTTDHELISDIANLIGLNLPVKFCPQGSMINGKITTTVSSNNLTVAIKTLAGNDPTATDPVYVRIGNSIRTITAALSVTKNAGTNWFGSGGSMFATFEIDYFVYLGYNTTDGVVLGFARIPFARTYGDFNTTSTNEYYAAISTITNAASTDEYEVIGRFNAILSATASFNWSIPGTSIIINRPIFNTRALTYTPTFSGTLGSGGTLTGTYTITNRYMDIKIYTVLGTSPSHGSGVNYTTPFTVDATEFNTNASNNANSLGQFYDSSGAAGYLLFTRLESTTQMRPIYLGAANGNTAGPPPQTPAVSDVFAQRVRYQMA